VIEFGVLGPLTVRRDGRPVELNAAMLRALLVLLLHRPGTPLSAEHIVDALWAGRPPASARKTMQVYIGRLRRALGDEHRISHSPSGYAIVVEPDELDTTRFRGLIDCGRERRQRGELALADSSLTEALALWRGRPFADLDEAGAVAEEVRLLEERWLTTHEQRAAVRLNLRLHQDVIADVSGLIATHPYQERLISYLMLALYRSDRRSDALNLYQRVRKQLAEELGLEPGATLSWLQQAILRADGRLWRVSAEQLDSPERLTAPSIAQDKPVAPAVGVLIPTGVVPAQLPPDVSGFTGRSRELATLDSLLPAAGDPPGAVAICAVWGTAGVGKSALVVHWAHRLRDRFPDGQLYVNLRGFGASGAIMASAEAVRRFLDALSVAPQHIPVDPQAQVDLYRTLLAGKRMLVVLDNARDPDQVGPLLPGEPGCVVVVTSRNRLTGLIATVGARPLALELLTPAEAEEMLIRRVGAARAGAEPLAVADLIALCARLPLALAIVAANALTRPRLPLGTLADQLRDSHDRLAALSTSDAAATDARAVFSWSYQALGPQPARLFRLLGLDPGPDIGVAAVASLAAVPVEQALLLLQELAVANLVTEHAAGRYTLHDLLRAYAAELVHGTATQEDRHAATGRLLDHYLQTAYAAVRLLEPGRDPITPIPPRPGIAPEHLAGHEQALGWFAVEHAALIAAVDHAAASGFDSHAWQLAWTLRTFLDRHGEWHRWVATQRVALAATTRLGGPAIQAPAHRHLANAYTRLHRFDDAHRHLRHALELSLRAGDAVEQAHTHQNLAHVWERQERHHEALEHTQVALGLYRAVGHRRGQARCLNGIGWYHTLLGDHEKALATCRQALALLQELDDRPAQAVTWDSLGLAHHRLGQHGQAVACFRHALDLARELGDRCHEAAALIHIGDTHCAAGDPGAARDVWQQALTILDDLHHAGAEEVRAKLEVDR
jgi:DNA-binding SARP family transcriptional activator/tetratricopeptide (TPR) repeat protein